MFVAANKRAAASRLQSFKQILALQRETDGDSQPKARKAADAR